jgi:hypothetical protein
MVVMLTANIWCFVERTENPCVPGSIPGGTTRKSLEDIVFEAFLVFGAKIKAYYF